MRKIAGLLLCAGALLFAQAPQSSVEFLAPPPPSVQTVSAQQTAGAGGGATYYYWVIARYPAGNAIPAGPAEVRRAGVVGGANSITVNWSVMFGATTYDVLRTETPTLPVTGTGNMQVALAAAGPSVVDNVAAPVAYTITSAGQRRATLRLDNRDLIPPAADPLLINSIVAGAHTLTAPSVIPRVNAAGVLGPSGLSCIGSPADCQLSGAQSGADFTVVVFPDTQSMTNVTPPTVWQGMADYVVAQKTAKNIVAVVGVGDITDTNTAQEWTNAKAGWDTILAAGVPVVPILGNHDYDALVARTATTFDSNFGPAYFAGASWYKTTYEAGTNANYWIQVTVGTRKVGIIGLEFYPRTGALAWAAGIVAANPDTEFIINTHAYLYLNGRRNIAGDLYDKVSHGITGNGGQEAWDALVKGHSNITTIVSGHYICSPNVAYQPDAGTDANIVNQLFVNYQCLSPAVNGYMLLLTFKPSQSTVLVTAYSSALGANDPAVPPFYLPYRPARLTDTAVASLYNAGSSVVKGESRHGDALRIQSPAAATDDKVHADLWRDSSGNVILDAPGDGAVYLNKNKGTGPAIVKALSTTGPAGMILYVPAYEGTGDVAQDWSTTGKNVTPSAGNFSWSAGKYDNSLSFASNRLGVVDTSTGAPFIGLTALTLSAWFNTSTAPVNSQLIAKHTGVAQGSFLLTLLNTTGLRVTIINSVPTRVDCNINSTPTLDDGQWHHLAGTYDGSKISVYLDGAPMGSCAQTGVIQTTNDSVVIAGYSPLPTYTGLIDEVRIYNRALSATEIGALFANPYRVNNPKAMLRTGSIESLASFTGRMTVDADLTARAVVSSGYAFASLPASANGTILYCSDCVIANPCAGSGTGAIAKRLNGAWVCN